MRRSCGSRAVVHLAPRYNTRNITSPVSKLPNKVNVAPPTTSATKNRRRSAPPMVSGLLIEAWTGCRRGAFAIARLLGEQPRHEVDGAEGHPDAKENAGQQALGSALAEGERDAADH